MKFRGVFFDEEAALAVVHRLANEGFAASVTREKFAGEDDDEDHPWAVLTDAPYVMVELLVEEYEGWLDVEENEATRVVLPPSPLDLPAAPKRNHRPPE
ncbi:MAG: hypothetical protein JWR35_2123 [Marmoricola sp.]|jgi:hypothetical protein|nr:hypothetical protein [Marmoricola sp.]